MTPEQVEEELAEIRSDTSMEILPVPELTDREPPNQNNV
jgi:hypothetical protein